MTEPTVVEVLRIEEPSPEEGRRRVIVQWSDGTVGEAVAYFRDELLLSEGDLSAAHPLRFGHRTSRAITSTCSATISDRPMMQS